MHTHDTLYRRLVRPVGRWLALMGLAAAMACTVQAREDQCPGTKPGSGQGKPTSPTAPPKAPAPLSITINCKGSDSCNLGDTLTLTPSRPDKQIKSASVHIHAKGKLLIQIPLTEASAGTDKTGAKAFQLDRAHIGKTIQARMGNDPAFQADMAAIGAKVDTTEARIVSSHSSGESTTLPLKLDLATLWTGGELKPVLHMVRCEVDKRSCKPGDTLTFDVPGLNHWWPSDKYPIDKMLVALDGIPFKLIARMPLVGEPPSFRFVLQRGLVANESLDPWTTLLDTHAPHRTLSVTLTNDKGEVLSRGDDSLTLVAGNRETGMAIFLAAFVVFFLVLAIKPPLLRDDPPIPGMSVPERRQMALSLGKTQMFFWTLIVLTGWAYLWYWTQTPFSFNDTAMVLIGISAATAVGATAGNVLTKELEAHKASMDAQVPLQQAWSDATIVLARARADAASTPATIAPLETALADALTALNKQEAQTQLLRQDIVTKTRSLNIWSDLTQNAGESGTGLHRVQNIAFTLLMGLAFVHSVINALAMPYLPATALALMGISGGTYLGFKFLPKGPAV